MLALALLTPMIRSPGASAAEETITCASCGKQVKKSKAIKVVINGRVYYVCSEECVEKLKKQKK